MTRNAATAARHGGPAELAALLRDSRAATLATFAAFEAAGALTVPLREEVNPPLWELGHIGWFQDHWLGRNPQRHRGWDADPQAPRRAPARADADALYDSGRVAHASRWQLPLPDADATRADLAAQLADSLVLLADTAHDDRALYFHRLALLHEDMHHEAAIYTAQTLGLDLPAPTAAGPAPAAGPAATHAPGPTAAALPGADAPAPAAAAARLQIDGGEFVLGSAPGGFAFDNELASHPVRCASFTIDRRAVRWGDFLPFVESGGYANPDWWHADGSAWRRDHAATAPAVLRRDGTRWLQRHGSRWLALDPGAAAVHLSRHEAQAWCRWAGRRLPTEAEWEFAALQRPDDFAWGEVWEWTASEFAPYPGFVAHPYRDYSAPWFDGRPVLRGASWATSARLRHPKYRNYFAPHRNDIFAGFRSCGS